MKVIELTQGKFCLVDDEDYEYLSQWEWYVSRYKGKWYARRMMRKQEILDLGLTYDRKKRLILYMHRAIMKPPISMAVDHIDGNGLNNQRKNLEVVSHSENARRGVGAFKKNKVDNQLELGYQIDRSKNAKEKK